MCLIAFAWNAHPRWRLVLLGNRDEMHARPTEALHRWAGRPTLLAGKDLEAGGTWMGLGTEGRAAVVTNVRAPHAALAGASRGYLVRDYLRGTETARAFSQILMRRAAAYRPFNLLLFDACDAQYLGNHPAPHSEPAAAGVHGLSNADFNTPWPKTRRLVTRMQAWVDSGQDGFEPLWEALADQAKWPDAVLPDTGIGIELERQLSAAFVHGENYGTRASTLIAVAHDGGGFIAERRFGPQGLAHGQTTLPLVGARRDRQE